MFGSAIPNLFSESSVHTVASSVSLDADLVNNSAQNRKQVKSPDTHVGIASALFTVMRQA